MKNLKMITESNFELNIVESKDKSLYIMGIFSSAESKNKNGRTYPMNILQREIKKVNESSVKNKTCIGQLEHPQDSPETTLEKASILTEELEWKGNDVFGKARVLNTPSGKILKSLIEDGVRIGISSRGLGTVNKDGNVNEDFQLLTWDCVANPSNKGSWVNGIYEGKTFSVEDINPTLPTEDEIKEAIKQHTKKIWQVLNSFRD